MALAQSPFRFSVLVLTVVIPFVLSKFSGFNVFTDTRMVDGVPLQNGIHAIKCCSICAKNNNCTSVNYNKNESICELNSMKIKSSLFRLQQEAGWNVYEKLPCGLGYKSGEHCHHIQNLFQESKKTFQAALDFCHALGENFVTIESEQEKTDLKSNAVLADMYEFGCIWFGTQQGNNCSCMPLQSMITSKRSCDAYGTVVCERRR